MNIRAIKRASKLNVARLQTCFYTPRRRQRGAVALEYLVLASAMIIVFGALSAEGGTLQGSITDAFNNLFNEAEEIIEAE